MHIMHVIDSLAFGGAERMLVEIANRTVADGHRVSVCVTRQGCSLAGALRPEIAIFVLDRHKRFDFAAMQRFAALLKKQRVDVLHAHGRSSFSFLALLKMLHLIQPPIVFQNHYGIELDSSVPSWFRLWAKRYVAHYVGVAPKQATWAKDGGLSTDRISIIQNALDLTRFEEALPLDLQAAFGIPNGVLVGVLVGNIRREKGIDFLLAAVSRSINVRSSKILVVGGNADQQYAAACRAQSDALDLSDCILFVGQRPDVPSLLKGADFALLSSRSESGPLALIEYMAAGLPFVATHVGGIAEQVAGLSIPEFVPPDDVDAFAGALDRLLTLSSEDRRSRGRAGQAAALRHFDIRYAMGDWYKLYSTVDARNFHRRGLVSEISGDKEILS